MARMKRRGVHHLEVLDLAATLPEAYDRAARLAYGYQCRMRVQLEDTIAGPLWIITATDKERRHLP